MQSIRGVLLDVDGTLVDSNDAHARAWMDALSQHGIDVVFAKVRRCIGMGSDKLLPEVIGTDAKSPEGKRIRTSREEIFQQGYLSTLRPFPGARELLLRMKQAGLRLVVASSATEKELAGLLRICGADELIDAKTSSDDADRSKPDPDIINAALERIELPARQVILLGDTPYDVTSANRAGVLVVALRCGGWSDADLAGAVAIYHDPADLLAHWDSSPFVRPVADA